MKLHTISSADGKLLAIMHAGDGGQFRVRVRAKENQYVHQIELPEEAAALKPHEIYRRLKIHSPGAMPVFSRE
jgi:hypothetical protein